MIWRRFIALWGEPETGQEEGGKTKTDKEKLIPAATPIGTPRNQLGLGDSCFASNSLPPPLQCKHAFFLCGKKKELQISLLICLHLARANIPVCHSRRCPWHNKQIVFLPNICFADTLLSTISQGSLN